jgi:hypothetical protein
VKQEGVPNRPLNSSTGCKTVLNALLSGCSPVHQLNVGAEKKSKKEHIHTALEVTYRLITTKNEGKKNLKKK